MNTYQPQLFDPNSATPCSVLPANGRCFEMKELYALLNCEMVQVVEITDELILLIDENGKLAQPAYLNLLATYLWYHHQPEARGVDSIVGRAILCHTSQFE